MTAIAMKATSVADQRVDMRQGDESVTERPMYSKSCAARDLHRAVAHSARSFDTANIIMVSRAIALAQNSGKKNRAWKTLPRPIFVQTRLKELGLLFRQLLNGFQRLLHVGRRRYAIGRFDGCGDLAV